MKPNWTEFNDEDGHTVRFDLKRVVAYSSTQALGYIKLYLDGGHVIVIKSSPVEMLELLAAGEE